MKYIKTDNFIALIFNEREHLNNLLKINEDTHWCGSGFISPYGSINTMINAIYDIVTARIKKHSMHKFVCEKLKNIGCIEEKFVSQSLGFNGTNVNISEYLRFNPRCVNKRNEGNVFNRAIDIFVNTWEAWCRSNYTTILLTVKTLEMLKKKGYKVRVYTICCAGKVWGNRIENFEKKIINNFVFGLKIVKDYSDEKIKKSFFINTRMKGINDNIYWANCIEYNSKALSREFGGEFCWTNSYQQNNIANSITNAMKTLHLNNGKEYILITDDIVQLVKYSNTTKNKDKSLFKKRKRI